MAQRQIANDWFSATKTNYDTWKHWKREKPTAAEAAARLRLAGRISSHDLSATQFGDDDNGGGSDDDEKH